MTLVPRTASETTPMKRNKPNLKKSFEKKRLILKVGREPFLEVDSLDGKGDEVEGKVEGGEMVEGSHQQGLHLVLVLTLQYIV